MEVALYTLEKSLQDGVELVTVFTNIIKIH